MCHIDFVIMWVDNNDPDWQKSYYSNVSGGSEDYVGVQRYRDWDIMRFWFRAVEEFAPWVHKIHVVTCGHYPDWLNKQNEKINLVKHSDIMPKEVLPTFSSRPIETHIYKIKGLSEKFVLFNDDMYLSRPLMPESFFRKGLPVDSLILNAHYGGGVSTTVMNSLAIINKRFSKSKVFKKYVFKVFNMRYGIDILRTLLLMPWPHFTGFLDFHQPQPFLKSTFKEVWSYAPKELTDAAKHRFRSGDGYSQYLFRYWHLASGKFTPFRIRTRFFNLFLDDISEVNKSFVSHKFDTICLNDAIDEKGEFEMRKLELQGVFLKLFPNQSSYESVTCDK